MKYLTMSGGLDDTAIGFVIKGEHSGGIVSITDDENIASASRASLYPSVHKNVTSKKQFRRNLRLLELIRTGNDTNSQMSEKDSEDVCKLKKIIESKKGQEIQLLRGFIDPIPNTKKRDIVYIAAPSGSGKSVFCSTYAGNFRKFWPKRDIYLCSRVPKDESIDCIPGLIRINLEELAKLTEESKDKGLDLTSFKDSLVIFDDCSVLSNPKVKKAVLHFQDTILQMGRHNNIYCLITSHLLNNSKETRIIMQELNKLVLFPGTGSIYFIQYCLTKYLGFERKEVTELMKTRSRWILIHSHHPRYVMWQDGVKIL